MILLVTRATGVNGDGYGALLAFSPDGELLSRFSEDSRISDPRGLAFNRAEGRAGGYRSEWIRDTASEQSGPGSYKGPSSNPLTGVCPNR
jgi:hypothetical protein